MGFEDYLVPEKGQLKSLVQMLERLLLWIQEGENSSVSCMYREETTTGGRVVKRWIIYPSVVLKSQTLAHRTMMEKHASGNWIQAHQGILTLRTTRCWISRGIWFHPWCLCSGCRCWSRHCWEQKESRELRKSYS
jgi:hypothetical protein